MRSLKTKQSLPKVRPGPCLLPTATRFPKLGLETLSFYRLWHGRVDTLSQACRAACSTWLLSATVAFTPWDRIQLDNWALEKLEGVLWAVCAVTLCLALCGSSAHMNDVANNGLPSTADRCSGVPLPVTLPALPSPAGNIPDNSLRAKQVACGGLHTLVTTHRGTGIPGPLVAFGGNRHGQLGCGDANDRHTPVLVDTPELLVLNVAAGHLHSIVVCHAVAPSTSTLICGMGCNDDGQLGLPVRNSADATIVYDRPTLVHLPSELACTNIKSVCCGGAHTVVVDESHRCWSTGAATQDAAAILLRGSHNGASRSAFALAKGVDCVDRAIAGAGWTAYIKQRRGERAQLKTVGLRRCTMHSVHAFDDKSIHTSFTRLVLPDPAGYGQPCVLLTSHWDSDFAAASPEPLPTPEAVDLAVSVESRPSCVVRREGSITAKSFQIHGRSNLELQSLECVTPGITLQADSFVQRQARGTRQWQWNIIADVTPIELVPCEAGKHPAGLVATALNVAGDECTATVAFDVAVVFDPSMTRKVQLAVTEVVAVSRDLNSAAQGQGRAQIVGNHESMRVTLVSTHPLKELHIALSAQGVELGQAEAKVHDYSDGTQWHANVRVDAPHNAIAILDQRQHWVHVKVSKWATPDGGKSDGPTLGTTVLKTSASPASDTNRFLFVLSDNHTDVVERRVDGRGSVLHVANSGRQNEQGAGRAIEDATQTTATTGCVLEMFVECPHARREMGLVSLEAWILPERDEAALPSSYGQPHIHDAAPGASGFKATCELDTQAQPTGEAFVLRWTVGRAEQGWTSGLLCVTLRVSSALGTRFTQVYRHQPPSIIVGAPQYCAFLFAFPGDPDRIDDAEVYAGNTESSVWTGSTVTLVLRTDRRILLPSRGYRRSRGGGSGTDSPGVVSGTPDTVRAAPDVEEKFSEDSSRPRRNSVAVPLHGFVWQQVNTIDATVHPFRLAPGFDERALPDAVQFGGDAGATIEKLLPPDARTTLPYQHLFTLTLGTTVTPGRAGVRVDLKDEHGNFFSVDKLTNDNNVRLAPAPAMAVRVYESTWRCGCCETFNTVTSKYTKVGATSSQMVALLRRYVSEQCDIPRDFPFAWIPEYKYYRVEGTPARLVQRTERMRSHHEEKMKTFFGTQWRQLRQQDGYLQDVDTKKHAALFEVVVRPKVSSSCALVAHFACSA